MATAGEKKQGNSFWSLRRKKKKEIQEVRNEERVLGRKTPFYVREAYKTLRTNLMFSLPADKSRVILVTSAGVGEGKTTSSLNAAISFAATGAKVCLIDCDLRRPNVARLCGEKGSPGLTNVLVKMNTLDEAIRKSKYQNLDIVFSGDMSPNPSELLASSGMKEVLKTLAERYEYVFVDTPPVNVVTDASVLAASASGVLLVANQQKASKNDVARAINQLNFVKAKILGILLNNAEIEDENGRKYRYSKYHRYGRYYGRYGRYYGRYYSKYYGYYMPGGDEKHD